MHILFVGNSYTYYHDMPKMLARLCLENGKDVCVDSVTKGGRKLYENLDPEDQYHQSIKEKCAARQYDVLFVQEQSYFALADYEKFMEGVVGVRQMVNPKSTVLYATWGRKEGCPLLEKLGLSSSEMTASLSAAYARAAKTVGADLSPVGECFALATEQAPDIELYSEDLSHPSPVGSALAATVHYRTLFGEMPSVISIFEDLEIADRLCNVIAQVPQYPLRKI